LPAAEDSIVAPRVTIPPPRKNQTSSVVAPLPSIRNWHGGIRNKLGRGKAIDVENFEALDGGNDVFDALLGCFKTP